MKTVSTLLICFSAAIIYSQQSTMDIGTFLLSVQEDSSLAIQNEINSFLERSSPTIPIIDDIEFRIRNQAYRFDAQRYSLRLSPRGLGESIANKNVRNADVSYNKQRKKVLTSKLLFNRYYLIIELLYHQTIINYYKDLTVLYEDKISVLKKLVSSLDFDLNDIVSAENKLTKTRLDIINFEKNIALLKKGFLPLMGIQICFNPAYDTFNTFDTTGLVTVEYIQEFIQQSKFVIDSENVFLKNDLLEFQLAENRYKLEIAESKRFISFFEFAYDHGERMDELARKNDGKDYDLNRAFIMDIGFRIPYFNTDRNDINRRKLAYLSGREDFVELKRELDYRINKDSDDITNLVSQYTYLKARKNDVNAESSLKRYLETEGVDPLALLSLKESIINNDINMEEIKFNILRNYIRILEVTGKLSQEPYRNYLSLNQEVLKL